VPEPVAARPQPVRQSAVVDAAGACRLPQYPPLSRRNGETGTVTLKFLIDADGTMLEGHVDASSGHQRLDEAARQALALCRFKPGTVDGVPERSWARMRYVWKLD
jgi:protein TonB